MSSNVKNLIVAAVNAGQGFAQASDKVKAAIGVHLKTIKDPAKKNAWLIENVATPLAAAYQAKTGVALTAYISNRGTVAIKDTKPVDGKRSNTAVAAVMMMRKWFVQEGNTPKKPIDPVKRFVSAFEKLTAAQRRKVLAQIAG
jgi:hypothetical protein